MRRRASSTLSGVSGTSPKRTSPASGRSRPTISRRRVDLPQPLGPSRTVVRPGGRAKSIGPTPESGAKRLRAPRSSSTRSPPARGPGPAGDAGCSVLYGALAGDLLPQLLRLRKVRLLHEQDFEHVLGLLEFALLEQELGVLEQPLGRGG